MEVLSGEECANIHECFLLDLFQIFKRIHHDVDIFLTYTPEDSIGLIEDIVPSNIRCFPQKGNNLGERMANAFQYVFEKNYTEVILMGSDIPEIQPNDILHAFEQLSYSDICLGPTFDGGYYLIGMKKLYKMLFEANLKWGNKSVLEGTIDIINNLDLRVELTTKHRDIDTKEDLRAFKKKIDEGIFLDKIPPLNTIKFIEKCWSDKNVIKRQIKG